MRSRRHTTTGNLKKQSSLLCSRKRRQKLRNWASSSSRRAMGKAHEHPVFAPVCRCVRPFGAGWSPSPNEGVGTVLPPFGRGCEDERKSGIKPWHHFRRYGQPQLPAVRAVYGGFATPLRCMCSGVCFRAFVHDWCLLSPNRRWSQAFQRHLIPYLGNKALSKITAADLRSLYRTLQETGRVHPRDGQSPGLSARTVHGIHTTLHHALKTAMEQNLIPSNPAAEVDPSKFIGAPMKILTEAQLDTFMTAIERDEFWHDFFYTAVTTGLRRGDICGLMWQDFDAKQGTLHVRRTLHKEKGKPLTTGDTKTYAGTREIVLPPSTAQLLRERKKKAPTEWIFPNLFDPEQPIAPGAAYNRLKVLLKEDGLPGHPLPRSAAHLRHSCPVLRCGCQDTGWHSGSHEGQLHPRHLYAHHRRYAETSR